MVSIKTASEIHRGKVWRQVSGSSRDSRGEAVANLWLQQHLRMLWLRPARLLLVNGGSRGCLAPLRALKDVFDHWWSIQVFICSIEGEHLGVRASLRM